MNIKRLLILLLTVTFTVTALVVPSMITAEAVNIVAFKEVFWYIAKKGVSMAEPVFRAVATSPVVAESWLFAVLLDVAVYTEETINQLDFIYFNKYDLTFNPFSVNNNYTFDSEFEREVVQIMVEYLNIVYFESYLIYSMKAYKVDINGVDIRISPEDADALQLLAVMLHLTS
jgi:hypothetical protein